MKMKRRKETNEVFVLNQLTLCLIALNVLLKINVRTNLFQQFKDTMMLRLYLIDAFTSDDTVNKSHQASKTCLLFI